MISNKSIKYIKSLQLKKYRKQEKLFLVEGAKSVLEVLGSDYEIKTLLGAEQFFEQNKTPLDNASFETYNVTENQLSTMSNFKSNKTALAVVRMKESNSITFMENEWILALDDINDPGNLGTIIRIADWYGINKILCSDNTAELYNPKVIAASMGSFTRINIYYDNLNEKLNNCKLDIYGTLLQGKNVHEMTFTEGGIVLIGNESHGISDDLIPLINHKITIPRFGQAESLNAGIATAIICDNLRR